MTGPCQKWKKGRAATLPFYYDVIIDRNHLKITCYYAYLSITTIMLGIGLPLKSIPYIPPVILKDSLVNYDIEKPYLIVKYPP